MIELPRRKFLAGLTGLIATPAIVRASSIMPVRGWDEPSWTLSPFYQRIAIADIQAMNEVMWPGSWREILQQQDRAIMSFGSTPPEVSAFLSTATAAR